MQLVDYFYDFFYSGSKTTLNYTLALYAMYVQFTSTGMSCSIIEQPFMLRTINQMTSIIR